LETVATVAATAEPVAIAVINVGEARGRKSRADTEAQGVADFDGSGPIFHKPDTQSPFSGKQGKEDDQKGWQKPKHWEPEHRNRSLARHI
jgi:hypothetical protein